jgi:murein DD-endopeptidase MepM/ murein hydrolase activator NlpD
MELVSLRRIVPVRLAGLRRVAPHLFVALLVAACGTRVPAPVDYRATTDTRAPARSAEIIIVRRGDTLFDLSRAHNVSMRDLIEVNGLTPPYHLQVGQRLALPAVSHHVVIAGDTVYGVSRRYGVGMTSLVRANGLREPYTITVGQILALPGKAGRVQTARAAPPRRTDLAPPARTPGRFAWPVRGQVVSGFGPKPGGLHNDGINIRVAQGSPVLAADAGVVAYVGNQLRGFGNLMLIRHDGGWVTAYAHNEALLVTRGARVERGQIVARAGSTGNVDEPQLHFEIRRGTVAVDPREHLADLTAWLSGRGVSLN